MTKVRIKILASDFSTSSYVLGTDCVMTRAFKRSGLNLHEGGGSIHIDKSDINLCDTPRDLNDKVKAMYKYLDPEGWKKGEDGNIIPIEPADFFYDLELPEEIGVSY
jgi:hypothetical protein